MKRINFYVDGYNFYYGLRSLKETDRTWKKFYWLDIVKLFEQFINNQSQQLQKVYYFSASPIAQDESNRQRILFKANELINGSRFEVIKGFFVEKNVTCKVCNAPYKVAVEKRTDVNIAVQMVGDCALNNVDAIVLVSADSDLLAPLQFITLHYPHIKIKIYFPPGNNSSALTDFARKNKIKLVRLENSKQRFINSVLPDIVSKDGMTYTIPPKWKV